MYTHQVKWDGVCGESFRATNGVKQCGILSQLLFCLYIGVLFHLLKQSNVGCFIGNVYMGCVGYADDVLLAPSS